MQKLVLISDIHFNINTLPLAKKSLEMAIAYAESRGLPLVIAGDLHDTKANMRGECVAAMIEVLSSPRTINVLVLPGNHDRINEKGEAHSLEFLRPYVKIIDTPSYSDELGIYLLPYHHDLVKLCATLKKIPKGSTVVMHQGFRGAFMGEYVQDKTSISVDRVEHLRVFSGHYHRHQTLGTVTYIGNPYTMSFAEAEDGPKGFLVLNSDNTFTREFTNLRKHVVIKTTVEDMTPTELDSSDLLWLKLTGLRTDLIGLNRSNLSEIYTGAASLKVDLIPTDDLRVDISKESLTSLEKLDMLIDATTSPADKKLYLKGLAREIINSKS